MAFIHFAYTLFNQDFLRTKGFAHLQWYVNRIALSVVLPVRPPSTNPPVGLVLPDNVASGTFPRQSKKKKTSSTTNDSSDDIPLKRKRGNTVHYPNTDSITTSSPLPHVRVHVLTIPHVCTCTCTYDSIIMCTCTCALTIPHATMCTYDTTCYHVHLRYHMYTCYIIRDCFYLIIIVLFYINCFMFIAQNFINWPQTETSETDQCS